MRTCPEGHAVPDGQRYCGDCGSDMGLADRTGAGPEEHGPAYRGQGDAPRGGQADARPQAGTPLQVLALVGAAAVVLVLVVSVLASGGDGPDQVAATNTVATTGSTSTSTTTSTTIATTTTIDERERREDLFLEAVQQAGLLVEDMYGNGVLDDRIYTLEIGYSVCETTRTGLSADPRSGFPGRTPAEYLIENEEVLEGTPNGERTILTIQLLCPWNLPALEDALSGSPSTTPPASAFFDGNHRIGEDIQPGSYRLVPEMGMVSDCYWERVGTNGSTIDNDFVTAATEITVTIASTDTLFVSQGCASAGGSAWTMVS